MQVEFVIIIASIIASAFFSGMEIAFVSSNKLRIELNKQQGLFYAKILSLAINSPSRFIASMLIGNNISLVIYGIYMASVLTPIFNFIENSFFILLCQTIISTLLILFTAEFLPKAIFQTKANFFVKTFSAPATLINIILFPITSLVLFISNTILGSNVKDQDKVLFGKVDLNSFIKEHTKNISKEEELEPEIEIFQNALDFADVKVRECMVPRTEIIAVNINTSIQEIQNLFTTTGYSKILVFKESIDNIIGYVHLYDLFKSPLNTKDIVLPIMIVTETMNAKDLLNKFIKDRKNIALVLDEFGGTAGMITIEDVIEEIFGEIEDEHDKQQLIEKKISENEFIFSARHEIDYINEKYNLNLPESENYETIGGLIFHQLESIPKKGEKIKINQLNFQILNSSSTRINTIKLSSKKS